MLDSTTPDPVNTRIPFRSRLAGCVALAVLLMAVAGALAGCGKKPGRVDAPPDFTGTFPRTYPDPSDDS